MLTQEKIPKEHPMLITEDDTVDPRFQVYKAISLDLLQYAWSIEVAAGDYLAPPPPGIYVLGRIEPVMVPDQTYHYHIPEMNFGIVAGKDMRSVICTQVIDELTVEKIERGPVYVKEGNYEKMVLNAEIVRQKNKYLRTTPTLPLRGMEIAKAIVVGFISDFLKYNVFTKDICPNGTSIRDYLVNTEELSDVEYEKLTASIISIMSPIVDQLKTFVGNYDWNIYMYAQKECVLKIEQGIDHRAACWYHEQEIKQLMKDVQGDVNSCTG